MTCVIECGKLKVQVTCLSCCSGGSAVNRCKEQKYPSVFEELVVEALTKVFAVQAEMARTHMRKWVRSQHNKLRM